MIGHSDEFAEIVRKRHSHVARVDVLRDGAVIRTLAVHSGSVDVDRSGRIMRRFDATVSDPTGELTPAGIRDLLAPFGTELRIYRGVVIPRVQTVTDVDETSAAWTEGALNDTVADSGDLVLGTD